MGTSPSRERKRENNSKLKELKETIETNSVTLDNLKVNLHEYVEEVRANRENHEAKIGTMETEIEAKSARCKELSEKLDNIALEVHKASMITELDIQLTKLKEERVKYDVSLPKKIEEFLAKEREEWTKDVSGLKEAYASQRKYSDELTTATLNQEKEIKELKKKIEDYQSREGGANQTCKCGYAVVPLNYVYSRKHEIEVSEKISSQSEKTSSQSSISEERSDYEMKMARFNASATRIKEDLKVAEIRRTSTARL